MAILGQSFLHLAFLEKWLPESEFTITYVRMKKKSHEGPDAQGPWLSSAQLRGRNLQS